MHRWTTPKQIEELFRRSKYLIDCRGVDLEPGSRYRCEFRSTHFYVLLSKEDELCVHDQIAGVAVFDYQTGGVSSCFGSTALNALLQMRKMMVLEDVAGAW